MSIVSKNNLKDILNTFRQNVLDVSTYKGSEDGVVKKADLAKGIDGEETAELFSIYMKDENGNCGLRPFPLTTELNIQNVTPVIYNNIKEGKGSVTLSLPRASSSIKNEEMFNQLNNGAVSTNIDSISKTLDIIIDIGEVLKFNAIEFISGYGCPKNFIISSSTDGQTYTEVKSFGAYIKPYDKKGIIVLLDNILETRYVKITCNSVFDGNRYEFKHLNFYYDKNFEPALFNDYYNISGVPYYYRKETYNRTEIDEFLKQFYEVNTNFKLSSNYGGNYLYNKFATTLDTASKTITVNITFDDIYKINAFSMNGSGYGGVNDMEIYYSDDGVDYKLITTVTNANIYKTNSVKFMCFKNSVQTKYIRFLLKKNVSGNRYEFRDLYFYYDKKIDLEPSKDYINKSILSESSSSLTDEQKQKIDSIINTGDGTKFLSDNGQYITIVNDNEDEPEMTDEEVNTFIDNLWSE